MTKNGGRGRGVIQKARFVNVVGACDGTAQTSAMKCQGRGWTGCVIFGRPTFDLSATSGCASCSFYGCVEKGVDFGVGSMIGCVV